MGLHELQGQLCQGRGREKIINFVKNYFDKWVCSLDIDSKEKLKVFDWT